MDTARCIAAAAGFLIIAVLATPSYGAFPGDNGKIAFHTNRDGNFEIYSINANGGDATRLTNNSASDFSPAWSADGTKIAFTSHRDGNYEIYTMNADGTGQTRLTNNTVDDVSASWSPDGTKIAFATHRDGNYEVYTMNANGTSPTRITNNPALDGGPAWSPNGDRIAFVTNRDGNLEIYQMDTNGGGPNNLSNRAPLDNEPNWKSDGGRLAWEAATTGDPGDIYHTFGNLSCCVSAGLHASVEREPSWSPDGTKQAFATTRNDANPMTCTTCNYEIYSMASSGTADLTRLTNNTAADQSPDWQPVVKQYARPQGASPRRIALVPAFQQCTTANSGHKGALIKNSCVTPKGHSTFLTLGSPEANGQPANGSGFVKLTVFCANGATGEVPPCSTTAGDQLDAQLIVNQTDVRCQGSSGSCPNGALSDYMGNLLLEVSVRVTDRNNGGFGAGTLQDFQLRTPVSCAPTSTGNVGSTCSVTTTLDAVVGGNTGITEGKRTIWEIQSMRVFDGGADGVATTTADNTLFLSDGLFFP